MGAGQSGTPDAPPDETESGGGTALHYTLGIFYLLMAAFIIILAWVVPQMVLASSVTFTLIGGIIFICSVVQIVYTSQLASTACAACGPATP
jgi:heme/copper-type cytochrome/quinol oxidase subunit 1